MALVDISLGQWIGNVPKQIVSDTLRLSNESLNSLKKEKQYVVSGKYPSS